MSVQIKFIEGPRKGVTITVEEVWFDPRKRPGSFIGYSDGYTLYLRGGPFVRVTPNYRGLSFNNIA